MPEVPSFASERAYSAWLLHQFGLTLQDLCRMPTSMLAEFRVLIQMRLRELGDSDDAS